MPYIAHLHEAILAIVSVHKRIPAVLRSASVSPSTEIAPPTLPVQPLSMPKKSIVMPDPNLPLKSLFPPCQGKPPDNHLEGSLRGV